MARTVIRLPRRITSNSSSFAGNSASARFSVAATAFNGNGPALSTSSVRSTVCPLVNRQDSWVQPTRQLWSPETENSMRMPLL
ncbi:hypothetical protein LJ725_04035 [Reyranella aquatilis]|uniref:Uncharacterized protein n=1 Tax=Reyranella aquatilis TaxID=2035356 RepID=A0ABS8KPY3_9HYPH|nr:hypothetical protein [Reyranella aquatilis]